MTTIAPEMPGLTWEPHPEPLCEGSICDLPTGAVPLYAHLSIDGTLNSGWADDAVGFQDHYAAVVPVPMAGLLLPAALFVLAAFKKFCREEGHE